MNIAYVMRYWPIYGGGETITVTLANELVKRGHNVYIIYTFDRSCTPMPYEIDNRILSYKTYTIERFKHEDVRHLHEYIKIKRIDIMINQWGSTELCYKARIGTNCKLITCWHLDVLRKFDMPTNFKKKILYHVLGKDKYQKYTYWLQMKEHDKNYKLSDKYIFLSNSFLHEYLNQTAIKIDMHKVGAISNPLTYDDYYGMDLYDTKKNEVLFVGRIYEYHKRLSYVLRIWRKIEDISEFDEWKLTIVGDGQDMLSVKALAKDLNLERVSFEGFKNPRPYYEKSSIFMMTSAFEGFGMTLVEAQQYGVVPIAMDSYKSLHDILENDKNGIIVPNNDLNAYVDELKDLMSNEKRRKRLAIKGLETCKKFSIDAIVTQWESLFNNLMNHNEK